MPYCCILRVKHVPRPEWAIGKGIFPMKQKASFPCKKGSTVIHGKLPSDASHPSENHRFLTFGRPARLRRAAVRLRFCVAGLSFTLNGHGMLTVLQEVKLRIKMDLEGLYLHLLSIRSSEKSEAGESLGRVNIRISSQDPTDVFL